MNARTKRPGIHARNYGFFAVIFGAVVVGAAVDAGLLCAILWVLLWLGFLDAAAALRQAAVTTKWVTEFKTFVGIPHTKQMEMISGPAALFPVSKQAARRLFYRAQSSLALVPAASYSRTKDLALRPGTS